MDYLEKQAETLNDLVLINNDRAEGYQNLLRECYEKSADESTICDDSTQRI